MIVAEQPTEPFTPPDGAASAAPGVVIGSPELLRRYHPIAQPLVRPLQTIVRHVLGHELAQMTLPERITRFKRSRRIDPTNLSAKAFRFGLFDGSRTLLAPMR